MADIIIPITEADVDTKNEFIIDDIKEVSPTAALMLLQKLCHDKVPNISLPFIPALVLKQHKHIMQ